MIILNTIKKIKNILSELRDKKNSIGFVPTMGALHDGHLSLIRKAQQENDTVVCSIFVNPTQFNNPEDLKKYPRTLDADIKKLHDVKCDILFAPEDQEIFNGKKPDISGYDFGLLETLMEGKFRPGHFKGVGYIVHELFKIVEPNRSYFGKKDYQQLMVIKELVKQKCLDIEIIPCETVRESDGLAMSSRNKLLNSVERDAAQMLSKSLKKAKVLKNLSNIEEVKKIICDDFTKSDIIKLEYFEIVNSDTCININNWKDACKPIACIAAFVGKIRLIDNMELGTIPFNQ